MGHTNGDIDCMGASLGVYRIAKSIGKEAYIVNETSGISLDNFIQVAKSEKEYQNVIINKNEALSKNKSRNNHRRSADYIENATLTFQEVYASSASELVTELIEYSQKNH